MFRDISPSGHSIHVDSEYFREISSDHSQLLGVISCICNLSTRSDRVKWDNGTFRPPYTYSSNVHAEPSSEARCLIFGQTLRLLPFFMCANS